jgi:hypothetical protein
MSPSNATVVIYETPARAQTAVTRIGEAGFDLRKLSLAGRDCQERVQVSGCYGSRGTIRYWGNQRGFWDSVWSLLPDWAFLQIPGIGPVLVAGPLAGWIVAVLENASIFGELSALGACLYNIGIPRQEIPACEAALGAGKLLLVACGSCDEVSHAREILRLAGGAVAA